MTEPTHYDRLNVPPTATAQEIRHAYHALAKQWHPDHRSRPMGLDGVDEHVGGEEMAKINAAYEVLRRPDSRAAYDDLLIQRDLAAARQSFPPTSVASRRRARAYSRRDAKRLRFAPLQQWNRWARHAKPWQWTALGVGVVLLIAALVVIGDRKGNMAAAASTQGDPYTFVPAHEKQKQHHTLDGEALPLKSAADLPASAAR